MFEANIPAYLSKRASDDTTAAADLLEINYRLAAAIKEHMASKTGSLETYPDSVLSALDRLGVVYRQAERYLRLDHDWDSEQKPKSPASG